MTAIRCRMSEVSPAAYREAVNLINTETSPIVIPGEAERRPGIQKLF